MKPVAKPTLVFIPLGASIVVFLSLFALFGWHVSELSNPSTSSDLEPPVDNEVSTAHRKQKSNPATIFGRMEEKPETYKLSILSRLRAGNFTLDKVNRHIPRVYRRSSNAAITSPIVRTHRRRLSDMQTIKTWVKAHYRERKKHFKGHLLLWDKKIARFAQYHADSISQNENCAPEFNEGNEEYGENIFWGAREHGALPFTEEDCVDSWISQKVDYEKSSNRCKESKDCAAYLQIISKQSSRFGCGKAFCQYQGNFSGVSQFFVCNYYKPAFLTSTFNSPEETRPRSSKARKGGTEDG